MAGREEEPDSGPGGLGRATARGHPVRNYHPELSRLFQNMRASRETELAESNPLHVVTAWIGNSARIAAQHYLQVTDADFDRANQRGTNSGTVKGLCKALRILAILYNRIQ